jgi:hypothetical protein
MQLDYRNVADDKQEQKAQRKNTAGWLSLAFLSSLLSVGGAALTIDGLNGPAVERHDGYTVEKPKAFMVTMGPALIGLGAWSARDAIRGWRRNEPFK